jgi:hypothetical protein
VPFPFAHPAAVLPLRRCGLVLSAFFSFAISCAMVAVVELFGFSVIWQTFLARGETVPDRP